MKRTLLRHLTLAAIVAVGAAPARAASEADVAAMSRTERAECTSLTLTGPVSARTLVIIRDEMYKLVTLNLEGAALTEIPDYAFAGKSVLKNVTLPAGITSIGACAFSECRDLKTIALPAGVTTIGPLAFARTGLTSFTIPAAVAELGTDALFGCKKLATITLADGNSAYCQIDGAIYSADKTRLIKRAPKASGAISLPAELKVIEPYALSDCSGMPLPELPAGLNTIGEYAFSNCTAMAGTLTIPASVTTIGKGAFMGCTGLTGTLTVPATAGLGGPHVFSYLSGISAVELPANLEALPASTFELCSGVQTIKNTATVPPTVGTMALRGIDRELTYMDVPAAATSAYQSAPVWEEFTNYDSVINLDDYGFFSTDGEYRIKYVGPGPANGKYLVFSNSDNTKAYLNDGRQQANVWHLEFFTVNHNNLPYKGNPGSDILFIDGNRCKHINMAGLCWNDAAQGYANNANRTFAFYTLNGVEPDTIGATTVAIRSNGYLWAPDEQGTRLEPQTFSGQLPGRSAFVWSIEPEVFTAIESVETAGRPAAIFDLSGRRVAPKAAPAPGVYIVVDANGKSSKVKF